MHNKHTKTWEIMGAETKIPIEIQRKPESDLEDVT